MLQKGIYLYGTWIIDRDLMKHCLIKNNFTVA